METVTQSACDLMCSDSDLICTLCSNKDLVRTLANQVKTPTWEEKPQTKFLFCRTVEAELALNSLN